MFDPHVEIRLALERSIKDEHTFENAALELNTLKMALNIRYPASNLLGSICKDY